jgi:hypothetical protein
LSLSLRFDSETLSKINKVWAERLVRASTMRLEVPRDDDAEA